MLIAELKRRNQFDDCQFVAATAVRRIDVRLYNQRSAKPIDVKETILRRNLNFKHLDEAVAESCRLLASGYTKTGKWSLGQVCFHMRRTIEANMNGYPKWMVVLGYPLRLPLRLVALPRLLAGKSPKGIKTAGMFVPPNGLGDAKEVEAFAHCVKEFLNSEKPLHAHPGFGKMDRGGFNHFHAAHSAHHLNFLVPNDNAV